MQKSMTYAETGVVYEDLDPFKIACQRRAAQTSKNVQRFGLQFVESSRGESVQLVQEFVRDNHHHYFGHVEEGVGTKNLVADIMRPLTGKTHYRQIAQDTVAMIVNDMLTLGVLPITVAMHAAVADSTWFGDAERANDLAHGWGDACDLARCAWSGGETPALKGIIVPGTILLSGSSFGMVKNGYKPFSSEKIKHGDTIVIIESSGMHANGYTLARKIGERNDPSPAEFPGDGKVPTLYGKRLADGRMFGEALLDPTHIYVGLVEDCMDAKLDIHYAANITGHGWRKFMRPTSPFTYVIETLPTQLPVFDFVQEYGPVDDREAYSSFNMGAGFALYVPESQSSRVIEIARHLGLHAFAAGHVENGDRKVLIKPKNIEFVGETLAVR